MKRLHVVLLVLAAARCGRHAPPAPSSSGPAGATTTGIAAPAAAAAASEATTAAASAPAAGSPGAGLDDLWLRADEGEADDLARLADREGSEGLVEKAKAGASRLTALRALAYADGDAALPFLAEAAAGADEAQARAALESLADIAARPRRATDPEDAVELREGCDALLALARDTARPRVRRIGAIRFLRMTVDRGCARAADIPTDLDAPK